MAAFCCCRNETETPTATWTNDSKFVVSAGYDGLINWWDVATKKKVHIMKTDDYYDWFASFEDELEARYQQGYWLTEIRNREAEEQLASVAASRGADEPSGNAEITFSDESTQRIQDMMLHDQSCPLFTLSDVSIQSHQGMMLHDQICPLFTSGRVGEAQRRKQATYDKKEQRKEQEVGVAIGRAKADARNVQAGKFMVTLQQQCIKVHDLYMQAQKIYQDAITEISQRIDSAEADQIRNLRNRLSDVNGEICGANQSALNISRELKPMFPFVSEFAEQMIPIAESASHSLKKMVVIKQMLDAILKKKKAPLIHAKDKEFPDAVGENLLKRLFSSDTADVVADPAPKECAYEMSVLCEGVLKIFRLDAPPMDEDAQRAYNKQWFNPQKLNDPNQASVAKLMYKRIRRCGEGRKDLDEFEQQRRDEKEEDIQHLFAKSRPVKRVGTCIDTNHLFTGTAIMPLSSTLPDLNTLSCTHHCMRCNKPMLKPSQMVFTGGILNKKQFERDVFNGHTQVENLVGAIGNNRVLLRKHQEALKQLEKDLEALKLSKNNSDSTQIVNNIKMKCKAIEAQIAEYKINQEKTRMHLANSELQEAEDIYNSNRSYRVLIESITPLMLAIRESHQNMSRHPDENSVDFQQDDQKFKTAFLQMKKCVLEYSNKLKAQQRMMKRIRDIKLIYITIVSFMDRKQDEWKKLPTNIPRATKTQIKITIRTFKEIRKNTDEHKNYLNEQLRVLACDVDVSKLEICEQKLNEILDHVEACINLTDVLVQEYEDLAKIKEQAKEITQWFDKKKEGSSEDKQTVHLICQQIQEADSFEIAEPLYTNLKSIYDRVKETYELELNVREDKMKNEKRIAQQENAKKQKDMGRWVANGHSDFFTHKTAIQKRSDAAKPSHQEPDEPLRKHGFGPEQSKWMVRFLNTSTLMSSFVSSKYESPSITKTQPQAPADTRADEMKDYLSEDEMKNPECRYAFERSRNLRRYTLNFHSNVHGGVEGYNVRPKYDLSEMPEYHMLLSSESWMPWCKSTRATVKEMENYRALLMNDLDGGKKRVAAVTKVHLSEFTYVPHFGHSYVKELGSDWSDEAKYPWCSYKTFDDQGVLTRHAVEHMRLSHDGKHIAIARWDRRCMIFEAFDGDMANANRAAENKTKKKNNEVSKPVLILVGHEGAVTHVSWCLHDMCLASASIDNSIRLWSTVSGDQLCILLGHTNYVRTVEWSNDGKRLASGGDDGTIRTWDIDIDGIKLKWDRQSFEKIKDPTEKQVVSSGVDCYCLAWAPDGKSMITGHRDNIVHVRDTATLLSRQEFDIKAKCHTHGVSFSSDGQYVAFGGSDRTLTLCKLQNAKFQKVCTGTNIHSHQIWDVEFSPDNTKIATTGQDGNAKVWEVKNLEELKEFDGGLKPKHERDKRLPHRHDRDDNQHRLNHNHTGGHGGYDGDRQKHDPYPVGARHAHMQDLRDDHDPRNTWADAMEDDDDRHDDRRGRDEKTQNRGKNKVSRDADEDGFREVHGKNAYKDYNPRF